MPFARNGAFRYMRVPYEQKYKQFELISIKLKEKALEGFAKMEKKNKEQMV